MKWNFTENFKCFFYSLACCLPCLWCPLCLCCMLRKTEYEIISNVKDVIYDKGVSFAARSSGNLSCAMWKSSKSTEKDAGKRTKKQNSGEMQERVASPIIYKSKLQNNTKLAKVGPRVEP